MSLCNKMQLSKFLDYFDKKKHKEQSNYNNSFISFMLNVLSKIPQIDLKVKNNLFLIFIYSKQLWFQLSPLNIDFYYCSIYTIYPIQKLKNGVFWPIR